MTRTFADLFATDGENEDGEEFSEASIGTRRRLRKRSKIAARRRSMQAADSEEDKVGTKEAPGRETSRSSIGEGHPQPFRGEGVSSSGASAVGEALGLDHGRISEASCESPQAALSPRGAPPAVLASTTKRAQVYV